ncbi:MAG: electron transfer flavoprotein subunit alpha [Bryobacteraceae bacterium]
METVLFLAHTENGCLSKASLEALAMARSLGGSLVAGLVGTDTQAAANAIAACGAARFLAVDGEAFQVPRFATDAAAAEALACAAGATVVIAPGTSRWSRVLPAVAQRLGGAVDTHITAIGVEGGITVSRWYYRQRLEALQTRTTRPWLMLVESGGAEVWSGAPGQANLEVIAVPPGKQRTTVTGVQSPAADQQTIRPDAKLLFVTGAGWTKKQKDGQPHVPEAAALILGFLTKSQCSLGSSKSLVDLSGEGQDVLPFLTHLNQVGQTGSTPRHLKGLSTCCHGEEPHVVGWRFIKERRAINLDANCGWARGKADVLYVADAFEVMRKLNKLL